MSNPNAKSPLTFSGEEYVRRLAATRLAMDRAELDALIVTDPANAAWLTGWTPVRLDRHRAVVVTLEGAPHWWGPEIELPAAAETAWMADKALHGYPDALMDDPDSHPFERLPRLLEALGLRRAAIGVELDGPGFTAACIGHLLNALPSARLLDATGFVDRRRLVKAPEEIRLIQRAGLMAARAADLAEERAESGLARSILAAELAHATLVGAEDDDGAFPGHPPAAGPTLLTASGAPAALDDEPIQPGETMALAASCLGYHCAAVRTFGEGAAGAAARRAVDAALGAASPGATCRDVAAAAAAEVRKARGTAGEWFGASIGVAFPPRLYERGLRLHADDRTPLAAGMVLTLHASARLGDQTASFAETVLIGEDETEILTAH